MQPPEQFEAPQLANGRTARRQEQPLRILWFSHLVPYPPKGGVVQRSYNLLREVSRYHEVHLLAFNQRPLLRYRSELQEAVDALGAFCRVVQTVDVPADRYPFGRQIMLARAAFTSAGYTLGWLRSREMATLLRGVLASMQFDLVHFDTISLAPYLGLLSVERAVVNHHNVESHMMRRRAEREPRRLARSYLLREAKKIARYEQWICPRVDLNLTCSALDARRLESGAPGARVVEIPNGVDLEYFRPAEGLEEPGRLIFVGGMSWYPNRDAMLWFVDEIWPLVKQRVPSASMSIVGAQPPDPVRELAARDARVSAPGFVDDVRPYVDRAQVYVCPIRDGGGTRLKVLDALAMGKALVAHPIAVEGLAVEPERHVLLAETPRQFADQVARLVHDRHLRERLSTAGRRLVEERYDFREIGRRLAAAYEAVGAQEAGVLAARRALLGR